MRLIALLSTVAALVLAAVLLARAPEPTNRDRYRVAEERIEAARARGHIEQAEVERLRLALRLLRMGTEDRRVKVLRGEALTRAAAEVSACRLTDLTPWVDEQVGIALCDFSPVDR